MKCIRCEHYLHRSLLSTSDTWKCKQIVRAECQCATRAFEKSIWRRINNTSLILFDYSFTISIVTFRGNRISMTSVRGARSSLSFCSSIVERRLDRMLCYWRYTAITEYYNQGVSGERENTQCDRRNENEFPVGCDVISGGQRCALLSASVAFLNLIDECSLVFRIQASENIAQSSLQALK